MLKVGSFFVFLRKNTETMKKISLIVGCLLLISFLTGCKKKKDAAYYMEMVDSIRKAETVQEIQKKAGIYDNPVDAWFDTLAVHTLPIKSAGSDIELIGHFASVPQTINEFFNYPVNAHLKALALPTAYRKPVILLAEMVDSISPRLFLYTMDAKHQPIDRLCLFEQKDEDREEDFGQTSMEYFITTKYEITLIFYYQSHDKERKPELVNSRRYVITREGLFEETIIEIE